MPDPLNLLDVVALLEAVPDHGLRRGQVGTVVEELAPDDFEVEFSDDNSRAYALLALRSNQLIVLHYEPKPPPEVMQNTGTTVVIMSAGRWQGTCRHRGYTHGGAAFAPTHRFRGGIGC